MKRLHEFHCQCRQQLCHITIHPCFASLSCGGNPGSNGGSWQPSSSNNFIVGNRKPFKVLMAVTETCNFTRREMELYLSAVLYFYQTNDGMGVRKDKYMENT